MTNVTKHQHSITDLINSFDEYKKNDDRYLKCVIVADYNQQLGTYEVWTGIGFRVQYGDTEPDPIEYHILSSVTDYVIHYHISEEELTMLSLMFLIVQQTDGFYRAL